MLQGKALKQRGMGQCPSTPADHWKYYGSQRRNAMHGTTQPLARPQVVPDWLCRVCCTTRPRGSTDTETTHTIPCVSFLMSSPCAIQVPNFVTLGEVRVFEMGDPKVGGFLPTCCVYGYIDDIISLDGVQRSSKYRCPQKPTFRVHPIT